MITSAFHPVCTSPPTYRVSSEICKSFQGFATDPSDLVKLSGTKSLSIAPAQVYNETLSTDPKLTCALVTACGLASSSL